MRPTRPAGLLLLSLALVLGAPAGTALARERAARGTLAQRIESRVAAGGLKAGSFGVSVIALDPPMAVYEREALRALVPASVAKVVTAAAALDLLGPGWRYETTLSARGTFDKATGTWGGDLVLHGSGDPNLSRRGLSPAEPHPLARLAKAAADAGIRLVTGALVLDDGPFDREFLHPTWAPGDVASWFGAPVAGLCVDDSCSVVHGRAGDGERPVADPIAAAGASMLAFLKAVGIRVAGGARAATTPADRAGGIRVAAVENDLWGTLKVMNRRSQNFYASSVFKACGAAEEGIGSWASGERAVADAVARRGVPVEGIRIVDGSGLSRDNRMTAGALSRLLASLDADVLRGPILKDSLALPGDDEGTLRRRLSDPDAKVRVRAKTGTLTGVHALAGYVEGKGGGRGWAFAIILNRNPGDGPATELIDDVVREILDE